MDSYEHRSGSNGADDDGAQRRLSSQTHAHAQMHEHAHVNEHAQPHARARARVSRTRGALAATPADVMSGLRHACGDGDNWLRCQFELARAGSEPNLRPMEGLRGFAVFLVFLVHYTTLVQPWIVPASALGRLADALHTIGNSGVDLFFVLSGYLIYGSLIARQQPFLPYLRRRIARIYPAFTAVLLLYIALALTISDQEKIPMQPTQGMLCVAENFLLLTGFTTRPPIITVSWSLSYEMLYYLALPLLIAAFGLRHYSPYRRAVFFSATLMVAASFCAVYGGPLRLMMFVAGILLYEAQGSVPAPGSAITCGALLTGMADMLLPMPLLLKMGLLFAAFFLLGLCCFSRPQSWLARAFCFAPLRWLGNMSYSYYLLHGLVLKTAFAVLAVLVPPSPSGALFFWGGLAAMFVLTLPPCAALFILIERPYSLTPRAAHDNSGR